MLFSMSSLISPLPDVAAFRDVAISFFLMVVLAISTARFRMPKHAFLYILLWLEALFSTAMSKYIDYESTAITYVLFCVLVLLVSSLSNSQSRHDVKTYTKFYIILGCICSALIILSWFKGVEHGWGRYSIDVIGIAKNPNYINEIILLAFAFLLLRFVNKADNRLVLLLCMIIMTAGVLLTGTRAALITLLIIVTIVTMRYTLKGKSLNLIVAVSIVGVMVVYVLINYLTAPILMRLSGEEIMTDDLRTYMWSRAYNEYVNYDMLLGMGINGTTAFITLLNLPTICIHNVLLQFLCDQGIIGVLLFVSILISIWVRVKKNDRFNFVLFFITLYIPMLFQNGTVTFSFWWPLAFLEYYATCSKNGVINGIIEA